MLLKVNYSNCTRIHFEVGKNNTVMNASP